MGERPVALVTGASRGIGRGIALELAREGFDIAGGATAYDPAETDRGLGELRLRLEELGAGFAPAVGDVADLDCHEGLVAAVLEAFGRLDLFVCNAGVAPEQRRDVLETKPASFDRVLGINLRGSFFLAQRCARVLLERAQAEPESSPAIVFISSISAHTSSPSRAEYCLSKAALSHAAHILADRLAAHGVRVYDVRPGLIETDMTATAKAKYDQLIEQGLVPQGRWGQPRDVGRAVAALARGDLGYSTGQVIEVSGGMNIRHL